MTGIAIDGADGWTMLCNVMIASSGAATPWTAVAAVVLAAAGVTVSVVNLIRTRRSAQAQAFQRLVESIQAMDARAKRDRLYGLADKAWPWTDEEITEAGDVLQAFAMAGILARERMVPARVLAHEWGIAIMRVRISGDVLIRHRRSAENPRLWDRLDWLTLLARQLWLDEPAAAQWIEKLGSN